jgi:hypothetical protein
VLIDGQPAEPASDWEEVCWHTDEDVDYLEVEMDLGGRWRIQRQMMLAREDLFLFVGDALLGPAAAEIEYCCTWPLRSDVEVEFEDDTREAQLTRRGAAALALPLALPEWRAEPCNGALRHTEQGLELTLHSDKRRLYAPLFVALDRRRIRAKRTWRQLTVGENLRIQPPDVAVGYRLQLGGQQWLTYRSLGPQANRSLLGQNLSSEFLMGRFTRAGEVEELLEIE